jgi:signal transduction histidine kinase|tara:strand:- start:7616 stop:8962 length:1347 start_codon:yes stop_codon:yes gene_type:complete
MKISTRLSLTVSIIVSAIFLVFSLVIYKFSSEHRQNVFKERLKQRVLITEKLFLEKDSFSPKELETITDQFLHTLPEETEAVINFDDETILIYQEKYGTDLWKKISSEETVYFNLKKTAGMSRIFKIKGHNYLVVVTALDNIGLENLAFLKTLLILLALIGIPVISASSFIMNYRAFLPLSEKIEKANTISATNFNQRLMVYDSGDEIDQLAIAFNNLLDRLEASFNSQKSFIRNASHEIKNPLTAIMGEAEITVSKTRTSDQYIESLNIVLAQAERLNITLNNLLQLSNISSNEGEFKLVKINIQDLLFKIKSDYNFVNPENKIVIPVIKLDDKTVFGNEQLLKSAITNLIDNACKFSANQEVLINFSVLKPMLNLYISDNGIGISEEDKELILSPFYRGKNALKIKGSGVGLALASKIISIHKGTLQIDSKLDTGTNITVSFPITS